MQEITATALGSIGLKTGVFTAAQVNTLVSGVETSLEAKLTSAVHYKGTVADLTALNAVSSPAVGDMYNVGADLSGDNYVWNGTDWDKLAASFQLPSYLAEASLEAKYLQIANADNLGYVKTVTVNGSSVSITNNTLALTDVASASALSTLDGTINAEGGLVDRVEALEAVGAQANVLEGVLFKGNGDNAAAALTITNKTVTIDISSYALKSELSTSEQRAAWTAKQNALSEAQLAACNSGVTSTWKSSTDTALAAAATASDLDDLEDRVDALAALTALDKTSDSLDIYDVVDKVNAIIAAVAVPAAQSGS